MPWKLECRRVLYERAFTLTGDFMIIVRPYISSKEFYYNYSTDYKTTYALRLLFNSLGRPQIHSPRGVVFLAVL